MERKSPTHNSGTCSRLWLIRWPLTEQVGQATKVKKVTAADRIAARVARLPDTLDEEDRTAAVAKIEREEARKEKKIGAAMAGIDLTFSPTKCSPQRTWEPGRTG